jgi:uncharacterized protein YkwD
MRFSIDWWRQRRWRLRQATALAGGLALLLVAAAFLLGGDWGRSSASGAAAFQPVATLRPATSTSVPTARQTVDPSRLFAHVFATAAPTATPPLPTAIPPATPPSGSHQQVVAPPPASAPAAATPTPVPPAPPVPTDAPPPPAPNCPTASMAGFALDLFNDINSERANAGESALAADGCVTYVAELRSNDMATRNYFSHTSPDGTGAFDLLDAYGIPHGWAGENLARNNYPDDQSVAVAIRDLMASQGHRDNILSTNYTALGVAAVNDGTGMWYYTMVFIGPPL